MKATNIFLAVCLFLLSACRFEKEESIDKKIEQAETLIEIDPVQSVFILNSIKSELNTNKEKAKFAIVMSMAMERTGSISISDSLIQNAVTYYEGSGSADEITTACYYAYLTYYKNYDYEKALLYLIMAEHYSTDAHNPIILCKIYDALTIIYYKQNDYQLCLEYERKAKTQYKRMNDFDGHIKSAMRIATCFALTNKYDSAKYYLNSVQPYVGRLNSFNASLYYINKLILNRHAGLDSRQDIDIYINTCLDKDISWMQIAECHIQDSRFDNAKEALMKYRDHHPDYKLNPKYQLLVSVLMDSLKTYKNSLNAYRISCELTDSSVEVKSLQEADLIKEQFRNKMEKEKGHDRFILMLSLLIILTIGIIAMATIFYFTSCNRDKENFNKTNDLTNFLKSSKLTIEHDKLALTTDYNLLNSIFVSWISTDGHIDLKTAKEIDDVIGDSQNFMRTSYDRFCSVYPAFISRLRSFNLTDNEISVSCLYAMGMNGKCISTFTKRNGHYNISSGIRKKLGLPEHGTNLGPFLRNLLKSTTMPPCNA